MEHYKLIGDGLLLYERSMTRRRLVRVVHGKAHRKIEQQCPYRGGGLLSELSSHTRAAQYLIRNMPSNDGVVRAN